ncbi:myo-inositol-1(or 4)-monophosphatase [Geomicrobium halophilum]|uniref:Inositol-1-monophosphatase n=1 Tax=Geomicrobium halophilum TaxID=549000 RepID=A0A841PQH4_9BACL|nr:inositol monophosphatase family protein [Geomicrobium halophilum]MBB6449436.1 myo-inositol-1(or 4)-monophosphatase [Geomicrobium halophilum]
MDWTALKDQAIAFISEAAHRLYDPALRNLDIDTKEDADDLVTANDFAVQHFLSDKIKQAYPSHFVIGEEGEQYKNIPDHTITWIIDPIDGTTNYVHQYMNFAISIGIYYKGEGKVGIIYDVMADEMFTAVKGEGAYLNGKKLYPRKSIDFSRAIIGFNARWLVGSAGPKTKEVFAGMVRDVRATRSYGSASLELAYVAAGRLDAYVSMRLAPWDYAAAAIMISEAGGECTPLFDGDELFTESCSVLAGEKHVHEEMFARCNGQ